MGCPMVVPWLSHGCPIFGPTAVAMVALLALPHRFRSRVVAAVVAMVAVEAVMAVVVVVLVVLVVLGVVVLGRRGGGVGPLPLREQGQWEQAEDIRNRVDSFTAHI